MPASEVLLPKIISFGQKKGGHCQACESCFNWVLGVGLVLSNFEGYTDIALVMHCKCRPPRRMLSAIDHQTFPILVRQMEDSTKPTLPKTKLAHKKSLLGDYFPFGRVTFSRGLPIFPNA